MRPAILIVLWALSGCNAGVLGRAEITNPEALTSSRVQLLLSSREVYLELYVEGDTLQGDWLSLAEETDPAMVTGGWLISDPRSAYDGREPPPDVCCAMSGGGVAAYIGGQLSQEVLSKARGTTGSARSATLVFWAYGLSAVAGGCLLGRGVGVLLSRPFFADERWRFKELAKELSPPPDKEQF